MRLLNIPIGLVTSVLLARIFGPEQFGQYAFIMAIIPLLLIPVSGGLKTLLIREVAAYKHDKNWPLYKGIMRSAYLWVFVISLLIYISYFLLTYTFKVVPSSEKWAYLPLGLILLPIMGISAVRNAAIKGLGLPAISELSGAIIQPILFLFFIASAVLIFTISIESALLSQIFSSLLALILVTIIFLKVSPTDAKSVKAEVNLKYWGAALAPFMALNLIGTFNSQIGILALGMLGSDEQAAGLRVAERGAQFVSLSLTIVNLVISPHIVNAYKSDNRLFLQKLSRQSARVAFCFALPIGLMLLIFGKELIALLFGSEYSELSYMPMFILVIGQLFNVFFGSVGYLLAMTGNEKQSFKAQIFSVFISIALSILLIPKMGAIGAAIAVSTGIVVWNSILGFLVYKKIGIRPSAM
ncbi:oligosaccharide flippase family protein [Methylophaga sp. OBS3]|nr:oligosaccharide flippase family protein [Methylophaga sp. OBS3]